MIMLEAVKQLRVVLQARAEEAERAARLPADLLAQLKEAGLFRMFLPRSLGGAELELGEGLDVIEALGRCDGGIAWTVMIGAQTPHLLAMLPAAELERIYAGGPDVVAAGAMAPQGRAQRAKGGYLVDGRWSFATGCQHSDWLYGACVVSPAGGAAPSVRTVIFPAARARILENWSVLGMRASGSHDIAVEALFVPDAYTFDAAACAPSLASPHFVAPPLHIHLQLCAVAVGIAQGALDDLRAIAASGKKRLYSQDKLLDSPRFQHALGRAEADARATAAVLREVAARFWHACRERPKAAEAMAAEILGTTSWVVHTACDVVTSCYRLSGTATIRDGATLQRRFRDAHVMTQHVAATEDWITQMGAASLGHAPRIS